MLIAQRPTLTEENISEFRSRFVIEPLEPGFGYTLGNSLRRTLLSSIPGASVTSIKVDSVLHEFSTIEGVTEDMTEIILNLKGIVVSSEHDEPVVMYLRKSGAGDVTAAGAVVFGPGRRVLLVHRPKYDDWSFPKGKSERGEHVTATAVREVAEETGIRGRVIGKLGSIDFWFVADGRRVHKTVHHFLLLAVDPVHGLELSDEDVEVSEVAWVPLGEVASRLAYADERRLLDRVPDLLAESA